MISTPKKLKTAAINIALRTSIERVETHVAMAFGASVQPFTKMTPSVSAVVTQKTGFASWFKKSASDMVMQGYSFRSRSSGIVLSDYSTYQSEFQFYVNKICYEILHPLLLKGRFNGRQLGVRISLTLEQNDCILRF
jgi:hypothetical protein